jgi:hypothetical protein
MLQALIELHHKIMDLITRTCIEVRWIDENGLAIKITSLYICNLQTW